MERNKGFKKDGRRSKDFIRSTYGDVPMSRTLSGDIVWEPEGFRFQPRQDGKR